jgi:4-hydroxybenzoate polyprenyltransferase
MLITTMSDRSHLPSPKPDYRIGRIAMLTLVSGTTAFGLSGNIISALLSLTAGLGTALAGFYLDHVLDMFRDRQSPHNVNPLALGTMRLPVAVMLIAVGMALAMVPALVARPLSVIPVLLVPGVVLLLHIRRLETPLVRALGLGLLQAFYVFLGASWAGAPVTRAVCLAVFLFFAMTGGKVLGDVRDLSADDLSDAPTLPRRYGLVFARIFLCASEAAAYITGITAYFLAGFGVFYLIAMLVTAAVGTVFNIYFCLNPTPARARLVNALSLSVLGMLYVTALTVEGIIHWV